MMVIVMMLMTSDDDFADSDFIWYFAYKITPIHRNETIWSSDLRSFLG